MVMATRPIVCRTPTPDYPPRGAAVLLVAGYEYGPYGEVVREDGWYAAHNRIGYRGQYRERVAGVASDELVYHGYRYYSVSFQWVPHRTLAFYLPWL
jgi:hypothetical protein